MSVELFEKTISFELSRQKSEAELTVFADKLAASHGLSEAVTKEESRRLVSEAALESAAKMFQVETTSNGHGLDGKLVTRLTRIVDTKQFVYSCSGVDRLEIEFAIDGEFPVVGIEIWDNPSFSLPSGFMKIVSDDKNLVSSVVSSFELFFKN